MRWLKQTLSLALWSSWKAMVYTSCRYAFHSPHLSDKWRFWVFCPYSPNSCYFFLLVQFEALWVLTNIASGTSQHKRAVVDHGAVPKLVKLLSPTNNYDDVREQVNSSSLPFTNFTSVHVWMNIDEIEFEHFC